MIASILSDPFSACLIGFVIGSSLGSFLNVCAYRIPNAVSVVRPRSFCPGCQRTIPWHQNLPVISWLLLKGNAKCCSFKIPLSYFLVEFVTGLAFGYVFFISSSLSSWESGIPTCVFIFIMIGVILVDMKTMTIPDRFSMGGAVVGIILSIAFPLLHSVDGYVPTSRLISAFHSLVGLLIGSACLYWIGAVGFKVFGREALGEGDVKLLGCIGAFCGWKGALFAIFGGALIGCVLLLPTILIGKLMTKKTDGDAENQVFWGREVPFGPFLALAALLFFGGLNLWVEEWFEQKIGPILRMFIG